MRILQVFNKYRAIGGEEIAINRMSTAIRHQHSLYNCFYDSATWSGSGRPPLWKQGLLTWRNPSSLRQFERIVSDCRPDCFLFHNILPVGSFGLYPAAKKYKLPLIQYIHNYRPFSINGSLWGKNSICREGLELNFVPEILAAPWQNSFLKATFMALLLRKAHKKQYFQSVDRWIAISKFIKSTFVAAGIPAEKITVIKHSYTGNERVSQCDKRERHYLFLGRLIEEKGIKVLVEAWGKLRKIYRNSCPHLVICGHGELATFVESSVIANDKIQFAGLVNGSRKHNLLASSKALIVPSLWWEPLGLVAYEAYDHKMPVLAAKSGGLPELVLDGTTGLLHEPGNSDQIVSQIEYLEANPEIRRQMGQEGKQWLRLNASPDNWENEFNALLQGL